MEDGFEGMGGRDTYLIAVGESRDVSVRVCRLRMLPREQLFVGEEEELWRVEMLGEELVGKVAARNSLRKKRRRYSESN